MLAGIITAILIAGSLLIFRKSFPAEPRPVPPTHEDIELLRSKYFGFFMFFTVATFPVFVGSLLLFLWLFQPYHVSAAIPVGISFTSFALVPTGILDYVKEKRSKEWFEGFKMFVDTQYKLNYFKVLGILFKIVYGISACLLLVGLYQTFFVPTEI